MIPAYNKKNCAAFRFETGIHFRRKTDFFPLEDTAKSYSGFDPEPTRLQAEAGHVCSHPRVPRAHQAGSSRRSLACVRLSEGVRCHGPGLALLTNWGVQQQ
ncbi:hypothetical protein TNCV_3257901 [Trichonephila clavipes]|nr:hypothetical protein TNCV_3257901 [Trichonephila clavipes]